MRIPKKMLPLVALPFLFSSCVHFSMSRKYAGPKELPKELADYYAYEANPSAGVEKVLEEKKRYRIKQVELPAIQDPQTSGVLTKQEKIVMDYYEIKGVGKTPVIIVLPILGGGNQESKIFCSYFAEHGIASLIVHRDQKQKESANLENMEASLRSMVIDHKLVIDWIATQEKLDSGNIGVFGISMGGIKAALLSSLDRRVKATVLALSGGDIPYILINSKEKGVIERVEKIMKERGLSRKELYEVLKGKIQTDPARFAKYLNARNVLVVTAIFDKVVPYKTERELWKAIGRPEKINLLAGHYTSLLYIFYVRAAALEFFERKFAMRPTMNFNGLTPMVSGRN